MQKFAIIFFTVLLNSQISFGQFKNLRQFIPPEFKILDSASGDLNKDGINEYRFDTLARQIKTINIAERQETKDGS